MIKPIIRPPFFEIGPKSYLYGQQVLTLAMAADAIAQRYDIDIIFTTPFVDLRMVANNTKYLHVFAPHMDAIKPGRGVADILPQGIKGAGASGVMLNHSEKPLSLSTLYHSIQLAKELELKTIVCANTIKEAKAIALLDPDIIVAEPTELIGTGTTSSMDYVVASIEAVKSVNPNILVLQGAGIKSGHDVYEVIYAGAEGTGSSSGIATAPNPASMVEEMILALKKAWKNRQQL